MKLSEIETITGRVEDGAWVRSIPDLPGLALKVRGADCTAAHLLRRKLLMEMPEEARRSLSDAESERIALEVMIHVLLVDWNITEDGEPDADGKPTQVPVPCTPVYARAALTDPKTLLLREAVSWASRYVALLGESSLARDAKN